MGKRDERRNALGNERSQWAKDWDYGWRVRCGEIEGEWRDDETVEAWRQVTIDDNAIDKGYMEQQTKFPILSQVPVAANLQIAHIFIKKIWAKQSFLRIIVTASIELWRIQAHEYQWNWKNGLQEQREVANVNSVFLFVLE